MTYFLSDVLLQSPTFATGSFRPMSYLLFVGITNLFLGMGLAVLLQRRLQSVTLPEIEGLGALNSIGVDSVADSIQSSIKLCTKEIPKLKHEASNTELSRQRIPSAWLELLDVESFNDELEPAWCMIQTLSRRLSDRLFPVGLKIAQGLQRPSEAQVTGIHQQLTEVTDLLNQRQKELKSFLDQNQVNSNTHHSSAKRLMQLSQRVDQVASENLTRLIQLQPTAGEREKVLEALQDIQYKLTSTLYFMRDQSQLILGLMALSLDDTATQDNSKTLRDAADPESARDFCRAYTRWHEDESPAGRSLCLGFVDVNQVERLNREYTTGFVDRILAGVGRKLAAIVKSNGGFSRSFRLSGQTFAVLLGDMDGQAAILMMDRLRHALAAMTFALDDQKIKTTVNTAVVEVDGHESMLDALSRVEETMMHGKSLGRNQNALMLDQRMTVVEPQGQDAAEVMVQL